MLYRSCYLLVDLHPAMQLPRNAILMSLRKSLQFKQNMGTGPKTTWLTTAEMLHVSSQQLEGVNLRGYIVLIIYIHKKRQVRFDMDGMISDICASSSVI
jgi:hypothetical protein